MLKLELPNQTHKQEYLNMMEEWLAFGGRLHPAALKNNGAGYETWLKWMHDDRYEDSCPDGSVPQHLYFLTDDTGHILGAITIRHYLNECLMVNGGNIGFGIRPSERKKGYATQMLSLALKKCKEMGMKRVLVTCDADNIGSAKTIIANGGLLENEVMSSRGIVVKRFWIKI